MPRCPTRASGIRRSAPSVMPRPARRMATTTISSASRIPPVVSSGVSMLSSRTRRSRSASYSSSMEMSDIRRRKSLDGVARSRRTDRWRATSGWSTTVTELIRRDAIAWAPVTEPSRNVELKARDADPARTLERALAAGAREHGILHQRDTYFAVRHGRLKLREEEPGGATLIAYERPDTAAERVSDYRLVPVPDPAALRAALEATDGILAVVAKARRLLLWEDSVRIHLDAVEGLGSFLELEAVAAPGSDLAREHDQVARLRDALAIAYPQGQCAEASAIGALATGGGGQIAEVVVAAPSEELCTPCGGCRQRLREFAALEVPIHLVDYDRVRRTTSLAELLPLSFGPEHLAG